MEKLKFYKCNKCGNVIFKLYDSNVNVVCCNEPMMELNPQLSDGAKEKHLPVVSVENNIAKISVGEIPHPMTNEHYIAFIVLHTDKTIHIKYLNPTDAPECMFALQNDEKIVNAYAYCNLHSLWKI